MSPADRAAQYDRLAQIIAEAITRTAYGHTPVTLRDWTEAERHAPTQGPQVVWRRQWCENPLTPDQEPTMPSHLDDAYQHLTRARARLQEACDALIARQLDPPTQAIELICDLDAATRALDRHQLSARDDQAQEDARREARRAQAARDLEESRAHLARYMAEHRQDHPAPTPEQQAEADRIADRERYRLRPDRSR